ncbi:sigma-54-dependent Fis family transcriptional regulator [candidate division KSB1 bacterium]|nr:sigma-54-dependent Fis family transcriptional regulator [candidate division KSB1 bacterium]
MPHHILIVDDDDITRESLASVFSNRGYVCTQASNGEEALEFIRGNEFDVVISDIEMPNLDGLELLEKASQIQSSISFIFITAFASVETAIEALRKGAFDYLLKPLNFEDVVIKVQKLLQHKTLVVENQALRQEVNAQYDFNNIIGQSKAIRNVFDTIKKVSDSDSNVLITGNSGTGKELVAKAIHYNSPRSKGRFMAVNCGAITETLFESELFGHKRGSFTGAVMDKEGLFKVAQRGTLFLDEISEMPFTAQSKLLRAIESKEILPVGDTTTIKVDVRILAATNTSLMKMVQMKKFREDLYYRLNVIEIHLPSLRERREDIPLLVRHFVEKYNRQMNKKITRIDPELMDLLKQREWKGEVRELENYIERVMIFSDGTCLKILTGDDVPQQPIKKISNLKSAVEDFERCFIMNQLEKNKYHRGQTAKALGIGEATLYRKMSQYGIDDQD